MRDLNKGHLPAGSRGLLRPVALAYRRTGRALRAQGMDGRVAEPRALDAAYDEYRRLKPEAATLARLEISALVNPMIAVAINANPEWFWHGPDV